MTKTKFDWKPFLKLLCAIAIPVALQNLLTTTGSMVDTIMIAPLGETTVGAVGLCAQFSSLMFSGYWGFVGGGMLFFAQYWGAKDDRGITRSYGTTAFFLTLVAVIFTSLAVFFPESVMRLYTDKTAIQKIGVEYLSVVGFGYPFVILSMLMSALLRSTERVRIPLLAAVISVSVNMLGNWIFIYGKLGLPAMGVRGAALATVLANVTNSLIILIAAGATGYRYIFMFRDHFRWSKAWIGTYLTKCFPILCNELFLGISNMIINVVLGRQPEEAIAAIAVFRTLEGLVIGFFMGFSNAASVLVGKCVGAGELEIAYQRAKRLVYLCGGCIGLLCLLLLLFHRPILTVMSLKGESYRLGTGILIIYCIAAMIRMCNWVQNDTYRSAGDAAFGSTLEITFMYLMVLPCVCSAGLWLKLPFFVTFAACYVDEPIRFILMQVHLHNGKWIKPVTPQGREALPAFRQAHAGKRR